jgi:sigma-B regulation protein RsbU (phosphoserine phosphatase)
VKFNGKTGDLILLKAKGIALGALEDIKLEEREIILESGDMVVFYTDGVTEAIDDRAEQFGIYLQVI